MIRHRNSPMANDASLYLARDPHDVAPSAMIVALSRDDAASIYASHVPAPADGKDRQLVVIAISGAPGLERGILSITQHKTAQVIPFRAPGARRR